MHKSIFERKLGKPSFLRFVDCVKYSIIIFFLLFQYAFAAQHGDNSKIAATVNGVEIKYSRIANVVDDRQKISLLETLVREEALYQKAVELKFTANSAYLKLLKEEKDRLLIDAYFAIETSVLPQPSEAQIETFISNNPHLFQGRKTWHYSKLEIDRSASFKLEDLNHALKINKSFQNIAEWLRNIGVDYKIETYWLGSEQINVDEYQALSGMALGQVKIISDNNKFGLLHVHEFYSDPRNPEDYQMAVSRGLKNDAIDKKINQIKKSLLANADYEILLPAKISQVKHASFVARIGNEYIKAENIVGKLTRESVISAIENKLVLQQVLNLGLNADPIILSGLNNLERRLLITQFLENQMSNLAAPEFQKVINFVKSNPQFFSQRKVYNFSILILNKDAKNRIPEFTNAFHNKNFLEIQSWLKAKELLIATNTLWHGPEKLSIEMLKALTNMKSGEMLILREEHSDAMRVLYKHSEHNDPIENQAAIDLARSMLIDIEKTRAGRLIVEKVRAKAKVDFMPELEVLIDADEAAKNNTVSLPLIVQLILLISLIPAIIWFWARSRMIDLDLIKPPSKMMQTFIRFTYTRVFLFFLTIIVLLVILFSSYYLLGRVMSISFTDRSLVSSSVIGFSLACIFGFFLFWINLKNQMLTKSKSMFLLNRWWPLVLVIFGQGSIFTLVLFNR